MFAARNRNDENAVYERQQAAASKPLNQGIRGLAPKTPGNKIAPKTPFKRNLNDENAVQGAGKTHGQGKQAGLFGGGEKPGKVDTDAFLTPAAPRTTARAPLGNKTTNAKARGLQTPAPPTQKAPTSIRGTSPRLRRAKVKIHQADVDPLNDDADPEVRETEYMPPREVPLPDFPSDDEILDRTHPQMEGSNMTQGWWLAVNPTDDTTDDEAEAENFRRKLREAQENERKAKAQQKRQPSTLTSKVAASALSSSGTTTKPLITNKTPSFAAPTATTKARGALVGPIRSKKPTPTTTAGGNDRHTAAKAASNSTIGYSKGRRVSHNSTLADLHKKPASHVNNFSKNAASPVKMPFGGGTTLDQLLGLHISTPDDEEEEEEEQHEPRRTSVLDVEDEYADFQLNWPVDV